MVEIIATSKVFQDGKIVIPSEVRKKLGIKKEDDTIVWIQATDEKRIYVMSSKGAAEEVELMRPHWIDWPKGKKEEIEPRKT